MSDTRVAQQSTAFDKRMESKTPGASTMNLAAASLAAREAAARIDARNRTKLPKRFRKQGIADEGEANALVDEWKHAARPTKRLHLGHGQHKGRRS
jgi:hypothetical protein